MPSGVRAGKPAEFWREKRDSGRPCATNFVGIFIGNFVGIFEIMVEKRA